MCIWVLAIGLPMGTKGSSLAGSQAQAVTSTAASVGPYRLCSSASSRAKKRSWSALGRASPLQMTRRRLVHVAGPRVLQEQLEHGRHEVDRGDAFSTMVRARYVGVAVAPGSAMTSSAPNSSGQKNSQTETSKLKGVFCRTRSSAVRPKASCIQMMRLAMARWLIIAPLGCPVEPDV